MKTIQVIAKLIVDETNPNCPSNEDMKLAVENTLLTPDNSLYGIKDVVVLITSYHAAYSNSEEIKK